MLLTEFRGQCTCFCSTWATKASVICVGGVRAVSVTTGLINIENRVREGRWCLRMLGSTAQLSATVESCPLDKTICHSLNCYFFSLTGNTSFHKGITLRSALNSKNYYSITAIGTRIGKSLINHSYWAHQVVALVIYFSIQTITFDLMSV